MRTVYLENLNDLKEVLSIFENELINIPYYNDLAKKSEREHYCESNLIDKKKTY